MHLTFDHRNFCKNIKARTILRSDHGRCVHLIFNIKTTVDYKSNNKNLLTVKYQTAPIPCGKLWDGGCTEAGEVVISRQDLPDATVEKCRTMCRDTEDCGLFVVLTGNIRCESYQSGVNIMI